MPGTKGAMFPQRPLDGPFKCRIFIKNNNLSALTDSEHNKPSSLYCSHKMLFRSRAKSRVIGCSKAFACVVLRYWTDTDGVHCQGGHPPPPLPPPPRLCSLHRANAREREEETSRWMCFVFSDSFPSPLIREDPSAPHHISSLFDSGRGGGCCSALQLCRPDSIAGAICVHNCELSCAIVPVAI